MSAFRSLLFVPGDSERKIARALHGDADALILDLEDSVAPARKENARRMVAAVEGGAKSLFVRINALAEGMAEADIAAAMAARPFGIVLPKSGSGRDVAALDAMLQVAEAEAGVEEGSTAVLAIATETAAATLATHTYGDASPRLWGMTWGAEDLATDLGAIEKRDGAGRYRDPFRFARMRCLFGAVAAEVAPVDTVFPDFRDEAGLRRECEEAATDGFTAKMAIHPAQVGPINEAFTPGEDALAEARVVVQAFEAAGDAGVVALEGRMLDRPHLTLARRLLARAR